MKFYTFLAEFILPFCNLPTLSSALIPQGRSRYTLCVRRHIWNLHVQYSTFYWNNINTMGKNMFSAIYMYQVTKKNCTSSKYNFIPLLPNIPSGDHENSTNPIWATLRGYWVYPMATLKACVATCIQKSSSFLCVYMPELDYQQVPCLHTHTHTRNFAKVYWMLSRIFVDGTWRDRGTFLTVCMIPQCLRIDVIVCSPNCS